MERINVLLIEDNPGDARLIKEMLAEEKGVLFYLEWKDNLSEGLKRLAEGGIDVVLLDLMLPDSRGFSTFIRVQEKVPLIPVVVLTGVDDETLAVRAVRKGAQDYLVKGKVDSNLLVRSIRYAIARKIGEERRFTLHELKEYDGKEGKPAYIAYKGKVYDVTGNRFWKNGTHTVKHIAGNDLTENMPGAPHSEEVLVKLHIVGLLEREKTFGQELLLRVEEMHLHPILVHFSIAYSIAAPLLALLYVFTGESSFEIASYYVLLLGFLAAPFAGLSGIFSWKVTYERKMTKIFARKIIFTVVLIIVITACYVWRALNPDVLAAASLNYIYLAFLAGLVPTVTILGYDGGKIVYA